MGSAVLTLVGVLALVGCVPAEPPRARLTVPNGVTATIVQYRSDIPGDLAEIEVTNGSRRTIRMTAAALLSGGYAPAPVWHADKSDPIEVLPGLTVDFPAALTGARCRVAPHASAEVTITAGGVTASRTVPMTDSHATLLGLWRADCFAEAAETAIRFAFASLTPVPGTDRAIVTLRATAGARAADGLRIVDVLPTTLLSPADGGVLWRIERTLRGSGTIRLSVKPTRCDLHAIAEDKVGSVLRVDARLPSGRTGTVSVVARPALRRQVLDWVTVACGTAG